MLYVPPSRYMNFADPRLCKIDPSPSLPGSGFFRPNQFCYGSQSQNSHNLMNRGIFEILNIHAIRKAVIQKEPYPYMVIDNVLQPDTLFKVVDSFPSLSKRGSFPLSAVSCSGHFNLLMKDLQEPELRQTIGERFGLNLEDKPPMITIRGYTTERDGHIHIDSEDKLITFLLYLNISWTSPNGQIRVLYNKRDLEPFAAEVSPDAGRCLIFQVTRDCWHGHTVFQGKRQSIQLNYVKSSAARERHLKRHSCSAFLKRLFKRDAADTPY